MNLKTVLIAVVIHAALVGAAIVTRAEAAPYSVHITATR